jgi:WD40 repeat protein
VEPGTAPETFEEPRRFEGLSTTEPVRSLAFSPDGMRVLACADSGTIVVWETRDGRKIRELSGPQGPCIATFMPEGQRVLSGHSDGVLRLWALSGSDPGERLIKHDRPVSGCYVFRDGRTGCSFDSGGTLFVWNNEAGKEIASQSRRIETAEYQVTVSSDGRRLVGLNARNRAVDLWDIAAGKRIKRFHIELFRRVGGTPRCLSLSRDGRFAACGVDHGVVYIVRIDE